MEKAMMILLLSMLMFFFMTIQQYICQKEIRAELKEVKHEIELIREEHEHTVVVYDDMIQMILKGANGDW